MVFGDNKQNKRIHCGSLPNVILEPAEYNPIVPVELETIAKTGIKTLKDNPGLSNFWLKQFFAVSEGIRIISEDKPNKFDEQEINVFLNTNYSASDIITNQSIYTRASQTIPFVSNFTRILWSGIRAIYNVITHEEVVSPEEKSNLEVMIYAWMYLLKELEIKEGKYGKTIKYEKLTDDSEIVDIILGNWEELGDKFFIKLSKEKIDRIIELQNTRDEINEEIEEYLAYCEEVSKTDKTEWHTYISLLNDLSQIEQNTIREILNKDSQNEKLRAIGIYNRFVQAIDKGLYNHKGEDVFLEPLFGNILNRSTNALASCCVRTEDGQGFVLSPMALYLAMMHCTYNSLFIAFHEFRLRPRQETAYKFFPSAYSVIRTNLVDKQGEKISTIDEAIEKFYSVVKCFWEDNSKTLMLMKYDRIQQNVVSIQGFTKHVLDVDAIKNHISHKLKAERDEINQTNGVFEIDYTIDNLKQIRLNEEKELAAIEEEQLAGRLVTSLNVIYMFCEAVRISLSNKHAMIKINDKAKAEEYRKNLRRIDAQIVSKIYENLDVLTYREEHGIDTSSLVDSEIDEERYRSTVLSDGFKRLLSELTVDFDNKSEEQILDTRAQIREELRLLPDCDKKDELIELLDDISEKLCAVAVERVKSNKDDFALEKVNLLERLGENAKILPQNAIDTLVTAEMLYERYATKEYAEKGFDFSSISALYYQSFETAYNELIWKDYYSKLTSECINDEPLISYFKSAEMFKSEDVSCFLGGNYGDAKKFVMFGSKKKGIETSFYSHCMYGMFSILIKKVLDDKKATELKKYFAQKVGYPNANEMLQDEEYIKLCKQFVSFVEMVTPNRNNASHGGTVIDVEQCRKDKTIVLGDLEETRKESMALVEGLIGVMTYHSK